MKIKIKKIFYKFLREKMIIYLIINLNNKMSFFLALILIKKYLFYKNYNFEFLYNEKIKLKTKHNITLWLIKNNIFFETYKFLNQDFLQQCSKEQINSILKSIPTTVGIKNYITCSELFLKKNIIIEEKLKIFIFDNLNKIQRYDLAIQILLKIELEKVPSNQIITLLSTCSNIQTKHLKQEENIKMFFEFVYKENKENYKLEKYKLLIENYSNILKHEIDLLYGIKNVEAVNSKEIDGYIIIDFRMFPFSLGEIFYHLQAAICQNYHTKKNKSKKYDILIFNPPISRSDQQSNNYNRFQKCINLIRVFEFFDVVNNIKFFSDINEFDIYKSLVKLRSFVWPYEGQTYRDNTKFINDYFIQNKFMPELKIQNKLYDDVRSFMRVTCEGKLPVILHIRQNIIHRETSRNTNLKEIKYFIQNLFKNFDDIKLYIICGTNEIIHIKKVLDFSNIIFVKEFNTSPAFDYALARTGAIFLGGPSGPSVPVIYSKTPYILFNYNLHTHFHFIGFSSEKNCYEFSNDLQKVILGEEDSKKIFDTFKKILKKINRREYFLSLNEKNSAINTSSIHELN